MKKFLNYIQLTPVVWVHSYSIIAIEILLLLLVVYLCTYGVVSLGKNLKKSEIIRSIQVFTHLTFLASFGRGELKKQDPDLYKVNPDTILIPTKTPIFIGTDGTEEFISIKDLNELTNKVGFDYSEKFISSLNDLASSRKSSQNDDASIFVKFQLNLSIKGFNVLHPTSFRSTSRGKASRT